MKSPIFFDMTGRRRRLVGRLTALVLILALAAAALFASTIVAVPSVSPLKFGHEREQPLPFRTHLAHLRHRFPKAGSLLHAGHPASIGFYVPWDEQSYTSLRSHYDQLDWVVAANSYIDRQTGTLRVQNDTKLAALIRNQLHRPKFFLMVQNVSEGGWFGHEMGALLRNPEISQRLIDATIATVRGAHWQGAVFDIENIDGAALPAYREFLAKAHKSFHTAGLSLALTVPAGEPAWNLRHFSSVVDTLYLMDYDQHWQGGRPDRLRRRTGSPANSPTHAQRSPRISS